MHTIYRPETKLRFEVEKLYLIFPQKSTLRVNDQVTIRRFELLTSTMSMWRSNQLSYMVIDARMITHHDNVVNIIHYCVIEAVSSASFACIISASRASRFKRNNGSVPLFRTLNHPQSNFIQIPSSSKSSIASALYVS